MNTIEQIKAHLAGIKEREDGVTEGPWEAVHIPTAYSHGVDRVDAPNGERIVTNTNTKDADFIAASRTDIPSLRAALERAVEVLQEFSVMRDTLGDMDNSTGEMAEQYGSKSNTVLTQILTILQPA